MKRLPVAMLSVAALGAAVPTSALAAPASAPPSSARSAVSGLDRVWLRSSIEGDRFEIAGGRLALRKSRNRDVRVLADRLVRDHTKSLTESVKVAKRLGVTVPSRPSSTEDWELSVVGSFSGRAFDRWYSRLEVADHRQDIEQASDEVRYGSNAEIKKLAADDLPVLRVHLKLARTAERKA